MPYLIQTFVNLLQVVAATKKSKKKETPTKMDYYQARLEALAIERLRTEDEYKSALHAANRKLFVLKHQPVKNPKAIQQIQQELQSTQTQFASWNNNLDRTTLKPPDSKKQEPLFTEQNPPPLQETPMPAEEELGDVPQAPPDVPLFEPPPPTPPPDVPPPPPLPKSNPKVTPPPSSKEIRDAFCEMLSENDIDIPIVKDCKQKVNEAACKTEQTCTVAVDKFVIGDKCESFANKSNNEFEAKCKESVKECALAGSKCDQNKLDTKLQMWSQIQKERGDVKCTEAFDMSDKDQKAKCDALQKCTSVEDCKRLFLEMSQRQRDLYCAKTFSESFRYKDECIANLPACKDKKSCVYDDTEYKQFQQMRAKFETETQDWTTQRLYKGTNIAVCQTLEECKARLQTVQADFCDKNFTLDSDAKQSCKQSKELQANCFQTSTCAQKALELGLYTDEVAADFCNRVFGSSGSNNIYKDECIKQSCSNPNVSNCKELAVNARKWQDSNYCVKFKDFGDLLEQCQKPAPPTETYQDRLSRLTRLEQNLAIRQSNRDFCKEFAARPGFAKYCEQLSNVGLSEMEQQQLQFQFAGLPSVSAVCTNEGKECETFVNQSDKCIDQASCAQTVQDFIQFQKDVKQRNDFCASLLKDKQAWKTACETKVKSCKDEVDCVNQLAALGVLKKSEYVTYKSETWNKETQRLEKLKQDPTTTEEKKQEIDQLLAQIQAVRNGLTSSSQQPRSIAVKGQNPLEQIVQPNLFGQLRKSTPAGSTSTTTNATPPIAASFALPQKPFVEEKVPMRALTSFTEQDAAKAFLSDAPNSLFRSAPGKIKLLEVLKTIDKAVAFERAATPDNRKALDLLLPLIQKLQDPAEYVKSTNPALAYEYFGLLTNHILFLIARNLVFVISMQGKTCERFLPVNTNALYEPMKQVCNDPAKFTREYEQEMANDLIYATEPKDLIAKYCTNGECKDSSKSGVPTTFSSFVSELKSSILPKMQQFQHTYNHKVGTEIERQAKEHASVYDLLNKNMSLFVYLKPEIAKYLEFHMENTTKKFIRDALDTYVKYCNLQQPPCSTAPLQDYVKHILVPK